MNLAIIVGANAGLLGCVIGVGHIGLVVFGEGTTLATSAIAAIFGVHAAVSIGVLDLGLVLLARPND
jgi:hypothetical protein